MFSLPASICSNSTRGTPEQCVKSTRVNYRDTRTTSMTLYIVVIVNFEWVSHIVLVFPLLLWQVNAGLVVTVFIVIAYEFTINWWLIGLLLKSIFNILIPPKYLKIFLLLIRKRSVYVFVFLVTFIVFNVRE